MLLTPFFRCVVWHPRDLKVSQYVVFIVSLSLIHHRSYLRLALDSSDNYKSDEKKSHICSILKSHHYLSSAIRRCKINIIAVVVAFCIFVTVSFNRLIPLLFYLWFVCFLCWFTDGLGSLHADQIFSNQCRRKGRVFGSIKICNSNRSYLYNPILRQINEWIIKTSSLFYTHRMYFWWPPQPKLCLNKCTKNQNRTILQLCFRKK